MSRDRRPHNHNDDDSKCNQAPDEQSRRTIKGKRQRKGSIEFLLNDDTEDHSLHTGVYDGSTEDVMSSQAFYPSQESVGLGSGRNTPPVLSACVPMERLPLGYSMASIDAYRNYHGPMVSANFPASSSKVNLPVYATLHPHYQYMRPIPQMPYQSTPINPAASQVAAQYQSESTEGKQPVLRYSHKLAERKRRRDMNEMFDELRLHLPFRNKKFSKWEILNNAAKHIDELHEKRNRLLMEKERLHRELGLPVTDLVNKDY